MIIVSGYVSGGGKEDFAKGKYRFCDMHNRAFQPRVAQSGPWAGQIFGRCLYFKSFDGAGQRKCWSEKTEGNAEDIPKSLRRFQTRLKQDLKRNLAHRRWVSVFGGSCL